MQGSECIKCGEQGSLSNLKQSIAETSKPLSIHLGGALRSELEDHIRKQDAEIERLAEELATHLQVHLGVVRENVRLREALQKIVKRPGLQNLSFSCDAQVMVDWANEALRGADEGKS